MKEEPAWWGSILGGLSLLIIPFFSYADPPVLTISNNSPDSTYSTTFKFNEKDCSTDLVDSNGLIKSKSQNIFSSELLKNFCGNNQANCRIDFYMSKNKKCTGPLVASIIFDTQKGITSFENKKISGFFVSKSGENVITIEGGHIQQSTSSVSAKTPSISGTNTTPRI